MNRCEPSHLLRMAFCCSIFLAAACLAEVREWTNNEGKTVRAELVEVSGETVKLKSAKTGRIYSLAVDSLGAEDRRTFSRCSWRTRKPPTAT